MIKEIVKILVKENPQIYDPLLLKKSELINIIKKINLENEILDKILNDEKFLLEIQIEWARYIFNYVE
jgi:hypothetical protein